MSRYQVYFDFNGKKYRYRNYTYYNADMKFLLANQEDIRFKNIDDARLFISFLNKKDNSIRVNREYDSLICKCKNYENCEFYINLVPEMMETLQRDKIVNYKIITACDHNHSSHTTENSSNTSYEEQLSEITNKINALVKERESLMDKGKVVVNGEKGRRYACKSVSKRVEELRSQIRGLERKKQRLEKRRDLASQQVEKVDYFDNKEIQGIAVSDESYEKYLRALYLKDVIAKIARVMFCFHSNDETRRELTGLDENGMFYVEFTTKKGEKMKCRINRNDCLNTMDRQEIVDTIWRIILGVIPPQEEIKIKKYDVQYLKGIVKRLKVSIKDRLSLQKKEIEDRKIDLYGDALYESKDEKEERIKETRKIIYDKKRLNRQEYILKTKRAQSQPSYFDCSSIVYDGHMSDDDEMMRER